MRPAMPEARWRQVEGEGQIQDSLEYHRKDRCRQDNGACCKRRSGYPATTTYRILDLTFALNLPPPGFWHRWAHFTPCIAGAEPSLLPASSLTAGLPATLSSRRISFSIIRGHRMSPGKVSR